MAKRIFIRWNWLVYAIVMIVISIVVVNTAFVNGEIIPEGWGDRLKKGAYRPYPILFLHGFAGGSNYTWNPDPNARNQAEEQKKPTAVLNKYFEKYFDVDLSLNNLTQFPYLETIEFFNSKSSNADQLMDRNSSVDRFKLGDYYVEYGVWWHKKKEGDPGWADKVSYALRGEPPHELSKYLYDDSPGVGGGPVLQNYLPPNATSFKVLLVCHSMGGLSAREYLTNKTFYPGAEGSVARLITIDTPHLGSALAVLADATVEVQRIATAASITQPALVWLITIPPAIELVDNGLEFFTNIDIDGDAVNDMDPVSLLGRFGSGFLGQLNARAHPQGVQYYIVYGSIPLAQIIDGFSIRGFIDSLMDEGISKEEIEELLEKEYGAEISTGIGEIIVTSVGDGVVSENSQRGILRKEENKPIRVFEIAKESIKGIHTEIGVNADHSAATKKVAEFETDDVPPLLKLIDYTKPRLEITKPQEGFVWESGVIITLEGKVYDEYLPADSSLKIELYKAGDNFNPVFSEVRKPDPVTGYTPLKPTTLWDPNNPSSPIAEFKEELSLPSGSNPEATYTIKLTVINPAGISSDPKQMTEKTFYLYGVAKDESGVSKLWCIDGPTSFADGVGAVVSEFDLVDEQGQNMSSSPLDIATSGSTIWVSFDDKKIYSYNRDTMKPNQLAGGQYYYTTTGTPDGLYYDGNLQYCSSETNRLYRISSSGIENELGVIGRNLLFDGDSGVDSFVDSPIGGTIVEYIGYNPTAISPHFLCSTALGKISKRTGQNSIQTLPSNVPTWTNEQDIPASVVGIAEITDYSSPEGYAIYLSCTDGNIYKIKFKDKKATGKNGFRLSSAERREDIIGPGESWGLSWGGFVGRQRHMWSYTSYGYIWMGYGGQIDTFRSYFNLTPPTSFIKVFAINRTFIGASRMRWDGAKSIWVSELGSYPVAEVISSICSFDEGWTAKEKFYNPVLGSRLWTHSYPVNIASSLTVTDVTDVITTTPFYYTARYGNESQDFPDVGMEPYPWGGMPDGYIVWGSIMGDANVDDRWVFLTDDNSLEVLAQFTAPTGIWEGITTGTSIGININPGSLDLMIGTNAEIRVNNGKGPYIWSSSNETVCVIEGDGEVVKVNAVGIGVATITVQDTLGNISYAVVRTWSNRRR